MIRRSTARLAMLLLLFIPMATRVASAEASYPPGDRPDTIAFGDTGALPGYTLAVVNVDFNAERLLRAYDPSDWSISDTVFVMIQVEATNTGDQVAYPAADMRYALRDSGGGVHELTCPAWPFPPEDSTLQPGETARFNLCFQAPRHVMSTQWVMMEDGTEITVEPGELARLVVHTTIMTDQWPAIFALDAPTAIPDCGCVPPPCSCTPPIGMVVG